MPLELNERDQERRVQGKRANNILQTEVILPDLENNKAAVYKVEMWMCSVGANVRKGEPLLQVRSGPALHLIAAPVTGLVLIQRVDEGAAARPGAVLAILES